MHLMPKQRWSLGSRLIRFGSAPEPESPSWSVSCGCSSFRPMNHGIYLAVIGHHRFSQAWAFSYGESGLMQARVGSWRLRLGSQWLFHWSICPAGWFAVLYLMGFARSRRTFFTV